MSTSEALLARVKIENFLSIRGVDVELGTLNVLIGRNASGKSNFLKALRFLSLIARGLGLESAARELGYERIVDVVFSCDEQVKARLVVESSIEGARYLYELVWSGREVRREALMVDSEPLLEREEPAHSVVLGDDGRRVDVYPLPERPILALAGVDLKVDARLRRFKDFLGSWAFYSFNPVVIRGSAPISSSLELAYDGRNLPQVLHTLLTTRRRVFMRVEEMLKTVIPEVDELLTPVKDEEKEVFIAIRERGFDEAFKGEQVPEGTLRLLAFITALSLPSLLVGFEEPENCVHPLLLETLVDLARRSGKQVFFTTHSPYLLDHVRPEEVYLVAKVDGATRIARLRDTEQVLAVRRYLEEGGTLGEAWVSGLLGEEY